MPESAGSLTLRYAQGEVFNSRKRFRVLVAGRRFGKSYLSCIELLRGAIERSGETFFYGAPTYRIAKDIAWKVMKKLLPKPWIKSKNETDLKLDAIAARCGFSHTPYMAAQFRKHFGMTPGDFRKLSRQD